MVQSIKRPECFTLANVISSRAKVESGYINYDFVLSTEEKESFCQVLGFGCREETKTILRSFIENVSQYTTRGYFSFDRVVFKNNLCTVTDHQSTNDMKRNVIKSIKAQRVLNQY